MLSLPPWSLAHATSASASGSGSAIGWSLQLGDQRLQVARPRRRSSTARRSRPAASRVRCTRDRAGARHEVRAVAAQPLGDGVGLRAVLGLLARHAHRDLRLGDRVVEAQLHRLLGAVRRRGSSRPGCRRRCRSTIRSPSITAAEKVHEAALLDCPRARVARSRRRWPAAAACLDAPAASAAPGWPACRGRPACWATSTSRAARAAARLATSESTEVETPSQTTSTARDPGLGIGRERRGVLVAVVPDAAVAARGDPAAPAARCSGRARCGALVPQVSQ